MKTLYLRADAPDTAARAAALLRAAGMAASEAAASAEYRNLRLSIVYLLLCPTPLPDGGVRDAGHDAEGMP